MPAVLAFVLCACGGRPAEIVAPVGKAALVEPDAALPHVKFEDGTVSTNDCCPVTKRKLSVHFPPVYINGQSYGFC